MTCQQRVWDKSAIQQWHLISKPSVWLVKDSAFRSHLIWSSGLCPPGGFLSYYSRNTFITFNQPSSETACRVITLRLWNLFRYQIRCQFHHMTQLPHPVFFLSYSVFEAWQYTNGKFAMSINRVTTDILNSVTVQAPIFYHHSVNRFFLDVHFIKPKILWCNFNHIHSVSFLRQVTHSTWSPVWFTTVDALVTPRPRIMKSFIMHLGNKIS